MSKERQMVSELKSFLEKKNISGKLIISFSGGADSLCLLSLFSKLNLENIQAIYINHNLRDEKELEAEIALNEENASKLNIPFKVLTIEKGLVAKRAKEKDIGLEASARELRYALLKKDGYDALFTAHSESDQVDTVLLRLYTGSTLNALSGIQDEINKIYRPLLKFSREDIEEYCKVNNLVFSTDTTNKNENYLRNFIRYNVSKNLSRNERNSILNVSKNIQFLKQRINISDYITDHGIYSTLNYEIINLNQFYQNEVLFNLVNKFDHKRVKKGEFEEILKLAVRKTGGIELSFAYARAREEGISFLPKIEPFQIEVKNTKTTLKNGLVLVKDSIDSKALYIDEKKLKGKLRIRLSNKSDVVNLKGRTVKMSKVLSDWKIPYCLIAEDDEGIVAIFAKIFGATDRLCKRFLTLEVSKINLYSIKYHKGLINE